MMPSTAAATTRATRARENATKSPSAAGSATCGSTIAIARAGTAIANRPRCTASAATIIAASAIGIIEKMVEYCAANTPLPQPVQPSDVGYAAAFLASPLAAGITGTTIYVDKGYHAMGMAVPQAV